MKRDHLILAGTGLAAMIAGFLLFQWTQPEATATATATADDIELHSIPLSDLDGKQTLLSDWDEPILVLNFWAPWCAPCRREIPALIEIQREYAARGVRILGLSFDGEEQVRRFAEEYDIDYPLFLTGNRSSMYNAAFGNPSGSLPYTALLGPERRIEYSHNGELTADDLREQLDALL